MFSGEYVYGTTMTNFCRQLTSLLDRDVIDTTGLTGHYDVHLFGLSDIVPGSPDSEPGQTSLAASLQAVIPRLGLRLEPAKATAEFLVIDHVEKPSEN